MSGSLPSQLGTEITRKQFLQYIAGALLMVFGLENLISLLTGGKIKRHIIMPQAGSPDDGRGFGTSRFGV